MEGSIHLNDVHIHRSPSQSGSSSSRLGGGVFHKSNASCKTVGSNTTNTTSGMSASPSTEDSDTYVGGKPKLSLQVSKVKEEADASDAARVRDDRMEITSSNSTEDYPGSDEALEGMISSEYSSEEAVADDDEEDSSSDDSEANDPRFQSEEEATDYDDDVDDDEERSQDEEYDDSSSSYYEEDLPGIDGDDENDDGANDNDDHDASTDDDAESTSSSLEDDGKNNSEHGDRRHPPYNRRDSYESADLEASEHVYLSSIGIGNPDKMNSISRDVKHSHGERGDVAAVMPTRTPTSPLSPTTNNNKKKQNKRNLSSVLSSFNNKNHKSGERLSRTNSGSGQSSYAGNSYGSLSLGGDTSMSSMDTFNNSPSKVPKKRFLSEPNVGAPAPSKSILREKQQPIVQVRRRYISSDDETSGSEEYSNYSDDDEISTSDVSSVATDDVSGIRPNRSTDDSNDTGNVSVPTISSSGSGDDGGQIMSGSDSGLDFNSESCLESQTTEENDASLPSRNPLHNPGDSKTSLITSSTTSNTKEKFKGESQRSSSEAESSGFMGESWNTPQHGLSEDSVSLSLSPGRDNRNSNQKRKGSQQRQKESSQSLSEGSWSLGRNWDAPKDAGDHWASSTDLQVFHDDDNSPSSRSRKSISSRKSRRSISSKGSSKSKSSKGSSKKLRSNSIQDRPRAAPPEPISKPRSAYDKNAPWYCGDSDEDDDDSDTSSVLSAFKKKKKKKGKEPSGGLSYFNDDDEVNPTKEQSMSFSNLMGGSIGGKKSSKNRPAPSDRSMSLGDLNTNNTNGDASLSFGNLQQQNGGGSMLLHTSTSKFQSSHLHLLEEESLQSVSLNELLQPNSENKDTPLGDFDNLGMSDHVKEESRRSRRLSSCPEGQEEENTHTKEDTKGKSIRRLQWIGAIGFILFLIFDVVLLTIFLVRRGDDNDVDPNNFVLATVPKTLCWDWAPGEGKSLLCSANDTLAGGAVANLLAEAIHVQSPQSVDITLIPAGLANADIPEGDFTYSDAEKVALSTSNGPGRQLRHRRKLEDDSVSLVIIQDTGARIRRTLELSLEDSFANGQTYSYPYASRLRYSVNSEVPNQNRVLDPAVRGDNDEWRKLESEKVYMIITTKQWADSYFQKSSDSLPITPLAALTEYAKNVKTLSEPIYSTREFV